MKSLFIAFLILMLVSCASTRYVEKQVPVETIKTEYITQFYKDTVFIHDSVDRYVKNDTVFQYKYKYVYKYLSKIDTVMVIDSIEIPIEIRTTEVQEVNKIRGYQSFLMYLGAGFILILIYKGIKLGKGVLSKII